MAKGVVGEVAVVAVEASRPRTTGSLRTSMVKNLPLG